jgi:serine/threonine protein kinase
MTPERWQDVERIFQAALDRDPSARAAFLDQACAGDAKLRREVVSLLETHERDERFLETPALEKVARALAGEPAQLRAGQRMGSYELVSPLGAGGMGEVWRAFDPALKRQVAIKVVPSQYARDPERLWRFEQEARAAGKLNHPNILTVYAIGEEGGSPYLVTELLEGATLRQRLASGALPEKKALEYAMQVAKGLAAAHSKGIVHRDLKPENIFVTDDGQVKILDFGLAKLVQPEPDQTKTESGTVMGSPGYMSPEQVRAQRVDHRSDIFALGTVLYEMLTGRRAFWGDSSVETMNAILKQDPPPLGHVSPLVEQIVRHCLEKGPDERFQSARDLEFQLHLALHPSAPTPMPPPTKTRRRYVGLAITALALLAATAGLTWRLTHRSGRVRAPELTQLTFDSGLTTDPSLSPDGKLVAFASDRAGEGNLDIWMQQIGTGEARRFTQDPADESEPTFSPDGARVAFRSEREGGGIYAVSTVGGDPRLIAARGRRPRFSPDGTHIVYWVGNHFGGAVFTVPAEGGPATPVQPEFFTALAPIWSPDGRHILFVGTRTQQEEMTNAYDWWAAPLQERPAVRTGALRILRAQGIAKDWPSLVAPAEWLDDRVLFSARAGSNSNLWRLTVPLRTRQATGLPERMTFGTSLEDKPAGGREGRFVFSSLTAHLNIWSLAIDANRGKVTGEPQKLTHATFDAHTSLSADGKKLVFISNRSGNRDVWLKDLITGKETALTATPVDEQQPDITADGTRIYYGIMSQSKTPEVRIGGAWRLYTLGVGPTGSPGVPDEVCEDCGRPWDWSPDGTRILFLGGTGPFTLSVLHIATRQKAGIVEHPKYNVARARFSPDGRWISFAAFADRPGPSFIAVIPSDGASED